MSGPVDHLEQQPGDVGGGAIEVREGRTTRIGDTAIVRVLPTKRRRAIGPWCFVDLISPETVAEPPPLEIGPHPHIGLATVTWLFAGSVLHTDSLGTEQPIRPGEVNLMTSGHGVAHAEEGLEVLPGPGGVMGLQLWLAQPDDSRHGEPRFEHCAEVPSVDFDSGRTEVIVGTFGGETSPVSVDHPCIGLDVTFDRSATLPIETGFEHAIVPIDRPVRAGETIVEPGSVAFVPIGRQQVTIDTRGGVGRVMLLGGAPLGTAITMWWNFVARSKDEIVDAWRDWQLGNDERFGPVPTPLARIDAPRPMWLGRD